MKKGRLILTDINKINKLENCEKWFIARMPMESMQEYDITWRYELAPSHDLFTWYLGNRHKDGWFKEYIPQYLEQLKTDNSAKGILNLLCYKLNNNQNVALICYCKNSQCHGSIIGKILRKKGYDVERLK